MFLIPTAFADTTGAVTEAATTVAEEAVTMDITIVDSLLYAAIGFAVVFVALLIIIGAIKLTSMFVGRKKAATSAPAPVAPAAPAATAAPAAGKAAPGSCGEMKLYNVSDKDAALIMAIIADETKTPLNELRFKSIKEIA